MSSSSLGVTRNIRADRRGRGPEMTVLSEFPEEGPMAIGWSRDGAVQEQIDATVESEVARARSRIPRGESRLICADCDGPIPEARRRAVPGVTRCVPCQAQADREQAERSLYNRR